MTFLSKYTIDIPPVDVLSYIFGQFSRKRALYDRETKSKYTDRSVPTTGVPTYINASNPAERLNKQELEKVVKKFGKGLKSQAGLKDRDVVLTYSENSV